MTTWNIIQVPKEFELENKVLINVEYNFNYVKLKTNRGGLYVFAIIKSLLVPKNQIGISNHQRQWMSVSLQDGVQVEGHSLESIQFVLSANFDVDSLESHNEIPIDGEALRKCISKLKDVPLQLHQPFIVQLDGRFLKCVLNDFKAGQIGEIYMMNESTVLQIKKATESCIDFILPGSSATPGSSSDGKRRISQMFDKALRNIEPDQCNNKFLSELDTKCVNHYAKSEYDETRYTATIMSDIGIKYNLNPKLIARAHLHLARAEAESGSKLMAELHYAKSLKYHPSPEIEKEMKGRTTRQLEASLIQRKSQPTGTDAVIASAFLPLPGASDLVGESKTIATGINQFVIYVYKGDKGVYFVLIRLSTMDY